jgi:acyl carrier protein
VGIDGHDPLVVEAVRNALDEVVGIVFSEADLDRQLEDTGVDSLDLIEVIMVVEEALDISTNSDSFGDTKTLRQAIVVFEQDRAGA